MNLTKREKCALDLYVLNGELNEGLMASAWPLIRNARPVTNSLLRKGLVTLGAWWDEGVGYELHLTDAGREALASAGGGVTAMAETRKLNQREPFVARLATEPTGVARSVWQDPWHWVYVTKPEFRRGPTPIRSGMTW